MGFSLLDLAQTIGILRSNRNYYQRTPSKNALKSVSLKVKKKKKKFDWEFHFPLIVDVILTLLSTPSRKAKWPYLWNKSKKWIDGVSDVDPVPCNRRVCVWWRTVYYRLQPCENRLGKNTAIKPLVFFLVLDFKKQETRKLQRSSNGLNLMKKNRQKSPSHVQNVPHKSTALLFTINEDKQHSL